MPLRESHVGSGVVLGKLFAAMATAGTGFIGRMVGARGKKGAKARPQAFQWNSDLHHMESVEGEK